MPMILNEEQTMLKDSAKDFCTANAPITQLRELRDTENADGFDQSYLGFYGRARMGRDPMGRRARWSCFRVQGSGCGYRGVRTYTYG